MQCFVFNSICKHCKTLQGLEIKLLETNIVSNTMTIKTEKP